jgi:hypothetical protein
MASQELTRTNPVSTIFLSFWRLIKKPFDRLNKHYPNLNQIIQLIVIYFFALIDLNFAVLINVYSLGYIPEFLTPIFPLIKAVSQSPLLKIWGSPEKVFFMSYVVIELAIVRKIFGFSKLVRYNILLIFALLMLQGLVISYWDLLFNRAISETVVKWVFGDGRIVNIDKSIATFFFLNTFIIFMVAYVYLFLCAIKGKYSRIPYMEWLFDSVAFWLKVKTPTMRAGNNKKTD